MKILRFMATLFLIYETSFYLVKGQTINNEKSDCTKLYNFLNGDSKDYANECCAIQGIQCDEEGYITIFNSMETNFRIPDITKFPYFLRIVELHINKINLIEIPDSILKLSSLKILNLFNNEIRELPNEIFNLKNLKQLVLGSNKIEVIPPAIQNLSNLEELFIGNNNIKKLPNEIFSLKNLRSLYLKNNPNLNVHIINFGNLPIKECDFSNINVLCYEPNTCEIVNLDNEILKDTDAQSRFRMCTKEEIENIQFQEQSNRGQDSYDGYENNLNFSNEKSSSLNSGIIIIGSAVVILIGILVAFMFIKKKGSKREIKSNSSFIDEDLNESVISINHNNNDSDCDNSTTPININNNKSNNINNSSYNISFRINNNNNNNNNNCDYKDEINNLNNNTYNDNDEISTNYNKSMNESYHTQNSCNQSKDIIANLSDMIQEIYKEEQEEFST